MCAFFICTCNYSAVPVGSNCSMNFIAEDDFEDESSDEAENKEDVPAQDSDEEAEQEDELEIKEVKED